MEEKIEDPFAACKTEGNEIIFKNIRIKSSFLFFFSVEIEKKKEELKKLLEAEELEMNQLFKRTKHILHVHGKNFRKSKEGTMVRFSYDNQQKAIEVRAFLKNNKLIAVMIPELEGLTPGIHEITLEISFNGQQYSQTNKKFKYMGMIKII